MSTDSLYIKPFKVGDEVTIRVAGKAPIKATVVEAKPTAYSYRYLCNWGTGILSHGWFDSVHVS